MDNILYVIFKIYVYIYKYIIYIFFVYNWNHGTSRMLYKAPYLPYFYIYFHHASCLETIPASGCPKVPGLGRSWKLFGEGGHSGVRSDSTHVPHISQLWQRNGWKWIKVPSTKVIPTIFFENTSAAEILHIFEMRCCFLFVLFASPTSSQSPESSASFSHGAHRGWTPTVLHEANGELLETFSKPIFQFLFRRCC